MAIIRRSLDDILASAPRVDRVRLEATTDEDFERQIAEDPDLAPDMSGLNLELILPPGVVRERAGLSQEAFAQALRVPLTSVQDWESAGFATDPAARSLLRLVAKEPALIIRLLAA